MPAKIITQNIFTQNILTRKFLDLQYIVLYMKWNAFFGVCVLSFVIGVVFVYAFISSSPHRMPRLKAYSVLASGCLVEEVQLAVDLPAVPWSCVFDHLDRLWVCLPVEREPVLCFRLQRGRVVRVCVC